MKKLKYIVGEPGVGKSTLVARALPAARAVEEVLVADLNGRAMKIPVLRWGSGESTAVIELGARSVPFSGTDTLSMAVQPYVLRAMWEHGKEGEIWVGEGDRLGNMKFLGAVRSMGWQVELIVIECDYPEAAARREHRAGLHGLAMQNPTWLAGRRTKICNVIRGCEVLGVPVHRIFNAKDYPETAATNLERLIWGRSAQ